MYKKQMYHDKSDDLDDEDFVIEEINRENIIKYLKNNDLIGYGIEINVSVIEKIFSVKQKDSSAQKWQFNLLYLKGVLESLGYFTTTRGMNEGIRTLTREEMPFYNESQNKKALKQMKSRQKALYLINPNDMAGEYAKKLEFEQLRNGSLITNLHNELKRRCN